VRSSPDRLVLRASSGIGFFLVVGGLTVYLLVDALARGAVDLVSRALPWLALLDWVFYLVMVRPSVVLTRAGITIVNVFVVHRVPWSSIEDIRTRFQVKVVLRGGRIIRSWGAPTSGSRSSTGFGPPGVRSSAARGQNPVHQVIEDWRERYEADAPPRDRVPAPITAPDTAAVVVSLALVTLCGFVSAFG